MKKITLFIAILTLALSSCKKDSTVNEFLFPVEKDIQLGQQLADKIASDPSTYPVLDSTQYSAAYQYLYALRDTILKSPDVLYKDKFKWNIKIIKDDSTLNAFAAPGGFIYVYTGLINYLDHENELIGVLGHEIAHADRRHSINQMKKNMGTQILISVALGNKSKIGQVLAGLQSLKFSRGDESEADEYSVRYLCGTTYEASGAAGFFEKIEAAGGARPPEFMSTHPSPDKRVEAIHKLDTDLNCAGDRTTGDYAQFKIDLGLN